MKNLWSPWRLEHVQGKGPIIDGCLFQPATDKQFDRHSLMLFRDTHSIVLLNRFPYNNGHLLIAPISHVPCLTKLDNHELHELMQLVKECTSIVNKLLQPDGINIGANIGQSAGAGIEDHLHFHLVPRWQDDHNFMTVISEIRSIPEHINTTFDRMLPSFQNLYHTKKNALDLNK